MTVEIKVWKFKTHYMLRAKKGKHSMGWRVNTPLDQDLEASERMLRLVGIVNGMQEREDNLE